MWHQTNGVAEMPESNIRPEDADLNATNETKPKVVALIALPQHSVVRCMDDLQRHVKEVWDTMLPNGDHEAAAVCWWHNGVIQFAGLDPKTGKLLDGGRFGRMTRSLNLLFERMASEDGDLLRKRRFQQPWASGGGSADLMNDDFV